jgi:HAD superfamily hydrolase (TIGR01509 family)
MPPMHDTVPKPRFTAVIFDMDGVLADTEGIHARAWAQTLSTINPEAVYRERGKYMGMATAEIAPALIREFSLGIGPDELVQRKRAELRLIMERELRPYPGLSEELKHWRGFPLALATSSARPEAEYMLGLMGLAGLFSPVITSNEVARAKPAPDCYARAIQELGRSPCECVALEDSLNGLAAAIGAGALTVAINVNGYAELPAGVTAVFGSTVEALRWLRSGGPMTTQQ